jgi:hypothetical protein
MKKQLSIPPTRAGFRKHFIELLRQNAYRHDLWTVWSDFVEISAIAISNGVDFRQRDEREARYMQLLQRYNPEEVDRFAQALGALIMAIHYAGFDDLLGGVFMELELGNKWAGQFFTPYAICHMMGAMNVDPRTHELVQTNGFIRLSDPCTGGGAMVIGFAHAMSDAGLDHHEQLHVVAQDLDLKAVHMAYVQLSLLAIPAVVIHGNTLAQEERSRWYTPAHILNGWTMRLRHQDDHQQETTIYPPGQQLNLFQEAA